MVATDAGWGVQLDGKPVRIPGGAILSVPQAALAEAIAAEWQQAGGAIGGDMSYADVPLTRIAGTVQERIAADPEPVILEIARYAESDLLCYRADMPDALVARQAAEWQPWLDWADRRYGARLKVTTGIMHVAQEPEALAALAMAVAGHGAMALGALGIVVPALGSLVLGLALSEGALDAATAFAVATVDERFQEELWGHDDEATARRARVAADVDIASRFLQLVRRP